MAVFSYVGIDQNRSQVRGTIAADTPRQARDQLRAQGLSVRKLSERQQSGNSLNAFWSRLSAGRSTSQWAQAVHELSMLLQAGVPMLEALDTLANQHSGAFRAAILDVRDQISGGTSLADAFSKRPDLFDEASVHLIEVGESSGSLPEILEQLADFKQRLLEFKDRVVTALIYPALLLVFGLAAAVFLMTFVMPELLTSLEETLDELPWPTRVVRAVSNILVDSGGWLLGLFVLSLAAGFTWIKTDRGRFQWHRFLLRLPIVGVLFLKQSVSRVAMIISTLSRSGVELPRAIELAERSAENAVIADALQRARENIASGAELADAFATADVFPPLAVRVFSVGQESGRLEEMLSRLSSDYEKQVTTRSARLTAMLEPALILVLAVFVGFILLATILPILEAGNELAK